MIPLLIASSDRLQAADTTWDGGGEDNFWQTSANWDGNAPPSANDLLFFTGTSRLDNTNNFTAGTTFRGITFNNPAGAFVLRGSQIALGGGITNNQVVTLQTINLPLALSASRSVDVVTDASLTVGGVVSGAGSGMVKTGGGRLTLGAVNTFSGTVTINGGTLSVVADLNLGAAPASPTPRKIVLDGGALETSSTFTLNASRGIAVGPSSVTGSGRLIVAPGTTLTYLGAIANNGAGTGGLTKGGFGAFTLAGANAYTGPTSNRVGTLFLDFSQATAPASDMISGSSRLSLGGENAGIGTVNTIQLAMNSKGSGTSSQTFNGTFVDLGGSLIRVTNSPGGTTVLNLGTITPGSGGAVTFITPTIGGGSGSIKTTSTNLNGILGGWATISGAGQTVNSIVVATNWASVNSSGDIVPYMRLQRRFPKAGCDSMSGQGQVGTESRLQAARTG